MMVHAVMMMPMVAHGIMVMETVVVVRIRVLHAHFADTLCRMVVHAEDAFNATDHAADNAADHGAHGPRAIIALLNAMGHAARNALRLRRHAHEADHGENANSKHCQFHLIFLWYAASSAAWGAYHCNSRPLEGEI